MSRAVIVVGLGFGDEGKGSIVDYLTRELGASLVVRFNGGAQAAHRVVTESRAHVFNQFGAGSLVPGVRTHLGPEVLVSPSALLYERDMLGEESLGRLTIDRRAVIVTPFHAALNQAREKARGSACHGSCGRGIGEARNDALQGRPTVRAADIVSWGITGKLVEIMESKREEILRLGQVPDKDTFSKTTIDLLLSDYLLVASQVVDEGWLRRINEPGAVTIFEGAQGALLDETHGFHPYTTWTDTTAGNADRLLGEVGFVGSRETIGVIRAYATRHGAGPFPTEDPSLLFPDVANFDNEWQGPFRVGHFDLEMLKYALSFSPVDALAVTCLDRVATVEVPLAAVGYTRMEKRVRGFNPETVGRATPIYRQYEATPDGYLALLDEADVPVRIWSSGPSARWKMMTG